MEKAHLGHLPDRPSSSAQLTGRRQSSSPPRHEDGERVVAARGHVPWPPPPSQPAWLLLDAPETPRTPLYPSFTFPSLSPSLAAATPEHPRRLRTPLPRPP